MALKENGTALLELMNRTGYKIMQENGQRKYGGPPPNWTGPPPQKGCEVFVGKIPRDVFEDVLVPIFEKAGYIYEMRLMMDFSGTNRGFAFVTYSNPSEAVRAIKELNHYPIKGNHRLGVMKSVDNCRLFLGGIPKDKKREDVLKAVSQITEGVVDVILYPAVADKSKSRGFAFVEYSSHRAAAMARRKLLPGKIQMFDQEIAVDWAEPEPEVDEEIMKKVTILYVRGLHLQTSEEHIRQYFCRLSPGIQKVKKQRDFAFIHFDTRQQAENVLRILSGRNPIVIDGAAVEVKWAKPVDKKSYDIQKQLVRCISAGQPLSPLPSNLPPTMTMQGLSPGSNFSSPNSFKAISRPERGSAGLLSTKAVQAAIQSAAVRNRSLEEMIRLCRDLNLGVPYFELLSNRPNDVAYEANRLYIYKVAIGDLVIIPERMSVDPDQAMDDAINYVMPRLAKMSQGGARVPLRPTLLTDPCNQIIDHYTNFNPVIDHYTHLNPFLAHSSPQSNRLTPLTQPIPVHPTYPLLTNSERPAESTHGAPSGHQIQPNLIGYWSVPVRRGKKYSR